MARTIDFMCWTLKPHSFFLLVNYIAMSVITTVANLMSYEAYKNPILPNTLRNAAGLFVLFSFAVLVLSLVAFLVYVFKDDYQNGFQRAYLQVLVAWVSSALVFALILLIFCLFKETDANPHFLNFLQRWVLVLILLGALLKWTMTLLIHVESKQGVERAGETDEREGLVVAHADRVHEIS